MAEVSVQQSLSTNNPKSINFHPFLICSYDKSSYLFEIFVFWRWQNGAAVA
ncbi:MAG: hypothetical protein IPK82_23220 [Polyangiaceae bacterium]|nr:hypothetical protein [Polyangiaceae bacterium]